MEPLIAALKDEDRFARQAAALALGKIGDRRAVASLIAALENEGTYLYVRQIAAEALGMIGDRIAVEPLRLRLEEESDDYVKSTISGALYKMGENDQWEFLVAVLLKDKDSRYSERSVAVEALGKIGDKRSVEPFIEVLEDEFEIVSGTAAWVLGNIGDKRAVQPFIEALKNNDEVVRLNAAWALGKIGDRRAVEPLNAALKDKDKDVRKEAEEALKKIAQSPQQDSSTQEHSVPQTADSKKLKKLITDQWKLIIQIPEPKRNWRELVNLAVWGRYDDYSTLYLTNVVSQACNYAI